MEAIFNEDIVAEILIHTTTKTLVRCRCVCKTWQKLISDPFFMGSFITRSKTLDPPLSIAMICHPYSAEQGFCKRLYQFDRNIDFNIDIALSFIPCSTLVIASHNGILLCIQEPSDDLFLFGEILHDYIICNPLTKQWFFLPKATQEHSTQNTVLYTYIKEQQIEFKVISFTGVTGLELNIEVFSSETKTWKLSKISHEGQMHFVAVLLNGFVYFSGMQQVYVYDIWEQSLSTLGLPVVRDYGCYLGASSGLLHYATTEGAYFKVWVHDDGVGWSPVRCIPLANFNNELPAYRGVNYVGFHPLKPHPIFAVSSECNRSMPVGDLYLHNTCMQKTEALGVLKHIAMINPIPYCLPAWIPCLQLSVAKR